MSDLPAVDWSYEETVQQVEAIMSRIESGELELADVFDQFASAVNYLRQCDLFLTQRQQQMDLLIETLTDDLE
jgi:exodeoxyribonuclease VII small subunit